MQPEAEAEERRLAQGFAQRRMHVDRVRDILQHRAHRQRLGEFAGQLGDMPADRLDPEDALILLLRRDAAQPPTAASVNARPLAANGNCAVVTSIPAAAASSGDSPALTISGSVKQIAATE